MAFCKASISNSSIFSCALETIFCRALRTPPKKSNLKFCVRVVCVFCCLNFKPTPQDYAQTTSVQRCLRIHIRNLRISAGLRVVKTKINQKKKKWITRKEIGFKIQLTNWRIHWKKNATLASENRTVLLWEEKINNKKGNFQTLCFYCGYWPQCCICWHRQLTPHCSGTLS